MAVARKAISKEEIQKFMERSYTRVIRTDASGQYVTRCLEFPVCLSQGKTEELALKGLDKEMRWWIEQALLKGHPIPPPFTPEQINQFQKGFGARFENTGVDVTTHSAPPRVVTQQQEVAAAISKVKGKKQGMFA